MKGGQHTIFFHPATHTITISLEGSYDCCNNCDNNGRQHV